MRLQNVATLIANPRIGMEYLSWSMKRIGSNGDATFRMINGAEIGGFVGFSEYHSLIGCITPAEQRFLMQILDDDPGEAIDIGANVGMVSLLLAQHAPERVIHAIEPAPSTFAALERNVARNAARNVRCHRLAISDAAGTLSFNADPHERATARIATAADQFVEDVPATTLDAFVAANAIATVAILKIDVEGFETKVLEGARAALAARLPRAIFMEMCPTLSISAGFDPKLPARIVAEAGYDWFRLEEDGALIAVTADALDGVVLENWVARPA